MTDKNTTNNSEISTIPAVQVELEKSLREIFGEDIAFIEPHAWKEYGLTIQVSPSKIKSVMTTLKDDNRTHFDMLIDVTCVDWLDQKDERFEIVYQLLSVELSHRLCVKVSLPETAPEIDSVRDLWSTANFLEREVFDMFGVGFKGHGDLRRILMYDEFVGHPLRQDYHILNKQPRIPLRVPELRNTSNDLHRAPLVGMPTKKQRL